MYPQLAASCSRYIFMYYRLYACVHVRTYVRMCVIYIYVCKYVDVHMIMSISIASNYFNRLIIR